MGKTNIAKTPPDDFKVTLLRIHYYHNKRLQVKESQYLIPTYSWTLTPIPNWTYSVVTIYPFQFMAPNKWLTIQCTDPSTWLTTNLRKMLAAKFFSLSIWWRSWSSLVTKPYSVQTQQLLEEKDELRQIVSSHNMLVKNLCIKLHSLASSVMTLKIILIYLGLWEKKTQTTIHGLDWNQNWKFDFHKSRYR